MKLFEEYLFYNLEDARAYASKPPNPGIMSVWCCGKKDSDGYLVLNGTWKNRPEVNDILDLKKRFIKLGKEWKNV